MDNYISIRQVLDDVLQHKLLQDVTLERAVNYSADLIRLIGCPRIFTEKVTTLHIEDYRAPLPCDYVELIQVRVPDGVAYRGSTDSFHLSPSRLESLPDLTYKVQGSVIFTSNKEGDIEIAYRAIATDEDGFPMIPDNVSFKKALEWYIKQEVFSDLFDEGKININSVQRAEQKYSFYAGQAQSDLVRPSLDQMESISNMLNQLVFRVNEHNNGFRNLGTREYIKKH